MKTVFANSAWVSALERLVLRGGRLRQIRLKVRFGLVQHPVHGPILIDTGYTPESLTVPGRSRILRTYSRVLRPQLNSPEQPAAVLSRFGLTPEDVRFVIVTHFHADHVSGLRQFPNAQFVANADAFTAVTASSNAQNMRHGVFPELLPHDFSQRMIDLNSQPIIDPPGLPDGRDLFGDGSLIAIDLPGHAQGHFGVLIQTDVGPLLYAVDAQWLRAALPDRIPGYPAKLIAQDDAELKRSCATLWSYMDAGNATLLCHDPETSPFDL